MARWCIYIFFALTAARAVAIAPQVCSTNDCQQHNALLPKDELALLQRSTAVIQRRVLDTSASEAKEQKTKAASPSEEAEKVDAAPAEGALPLMLTALRKRWDAGPISHAMHSSWLSTFQKDWEASRISQARSRGPATVVLNKLLAPPFIYIILAIIALLVFITLWNAFKEEMKPCVYGILDILAVVGLCCFTVLNTIWWAFKWCAFYTKETILDGCAPLHCSCCGFWRLKNPLSTQSYAHQLKVVRETTPGGGPQLPTFKISPHSR